MRALPLFRCGLLLVLMAFPALARDMEEKLTIRTLKVPAHPGQAAPSIHVSAQVVTALRFEAEKDHDSYNTVLSSLYDSLNRERDLREENERFKKEENSVDHAYATLLANGEEDKTPFRRAKSWRSKKGDMVMIVKVFSGPGKAAVVIHLTNSSYGKPWKLDSAYLTHDLTHDIARPFSLRMNRDKIVPGQSGIIAVVVDKSAFETEGGQLADLALQIFRGDGLLQVAVAMDHTLLRQ